LAVALVLLPAAATAHGAGTHAFGSAFGHGFYGGRPHSFYWRGFAHGYHRSFHHDHFGRDFARHGFGRWTGHGMGDHFGWWQPGHWHTASGFGGGGHWHQEGLWHL
jgi:hypothetical protein